MNTNHEQLCTHVAAYIYNLGQTCQLSWQETNAAIRIALAMLDQGKSAATAYLIGANAIRTIATHHAPPASASLH